MTKIIINTDEEVDEKHYTEYDELYNKFKPYEVESFIDGDRYLFIYNNRLKKSKVTEFLLKQILEFVVPILEDYPQYLVKSTSIKREFNILSLQLNNTILAKINDHTINIPANNEFVIKGLQFYKNYIISNNQQNNLIYKIPQIKLNIDSKMVYLDSSVSYELLSQIYDNILHYLQFYEQHGKLLNNYYPIIPEPIKPIIINPIKLYKENKLLKKIFEYIDEDGTFWYDYNIYERFKQLKLEQHYENINLYGFKIDDFNDFKTQKDEVNNIINNNKHILQGMTKYYKLKAICKQKFPNLFNPNHKDYIFNEIDLFSLNKLNKKQTDEILLEYEKSENYLKSFILNDCGHVKVFNEFRSTKRSNVEQYETFDQIKDYIDYYPVSKGKQFIDEYMKCKICKFDVLCPHLYDYYTKLKDVKTDKEEYQLKQYIIKTYSSNNQIDYIYTCKICSEELGKSADLEQFVSFVKNVKQNNSIDIDELKIHIIKLTHQIINGYIDFSNVVINQKVLTFNIVDLTYSYIKTIKIKLEKSKTSSSEEIMQKVFVYATIIIIACCINIMNQSNIKFKTKSGGKVNIQAIKLKKNTIDGFKIIMDMQKFNINKLNISSNDIKNLLLQFYKKISISMSPTEINESKIPILDLLKLSRVYNYVIHFNNVYPIITNKYSFEDYKILLNKDITKTNGENIYNNLRIPTISLNKQTVNIDKISSKKEFMYLSGLHMFKYLMHHIYKYTPYEGQYDKTYSDSILKDINEFNKFTKQLLDYENILIEENNKRILLPYAKVSFSNNRFYTPNVRNMSLFWDDDGIKHKFINNECIICKQSYEAIYKLSDEACKKKNIIIKDKLLEQNQIKSFFRYFTFRCPIELFHTFENNKCQYCSVTQDQLIGLDPQYYSKFIKIYKDILNKKKISKQSILDKISMNENNTDYYKEYELSNLSYKLSDELNEEKINLVAFSFNIKNELLNNLGKIENDSILSTYYKLYNYHAIIIILYNLLRNSNSIIKHIDYDFKKFIELVKTSNVDLNDFKILPDLPILLANIDFNSITTNNNMNNILLNAIITNLLFIMEQDKSVPQIKEFVKFLLDKVIKYDKLFQPYDRFKKDLIVEKNPDNNLNKEVYQSNDLNENEFDIFSNQAFDFDDEDEDNLNGEYE